MDLSTRSPRTGASSSHSGSGIERSTPRSSRCSPSRCPRRVPRGRRCGSTRPRHLGVDAVAGRTVAAAAQYRRGARPVLLRHARLVHDLSRDRVLLAAAQLLAVGAPRRAWCCRPAVLDATVAVCAGIAFAILPRITWAGIEARSYALTAAAAVWLTVLVVVAARRNAAALWPLYGLALVVSTLLNVFVVLMVSCMRSWCPWWRNSGRRWCGGRRRRRWPWRCAPFLVFCRTQIAQVRWISPVGWAPSSRSPRSSTSTTACRSPFWPAWCWSPRWCGGGRGHPKPATRDHRAGMDRAPDGRAAGVLGGAGADLLPALPVLHLAGDGRAGGSSWRWPNRERVAAVLAVFALAATPNYLWPSGARTPRKGWTSARSPTSSPRTPRPATA